MRKILFIIVSVVLCTLSVSAQKVTSFTMDPDDLEAVLNPVVQDGVAASLIRISLDRADARFIGDIAGTQSWDGKEWQIHVNPDAKELVVKVGGCPALNYTFPVELRSSAVYIMEIEVKSIDEYRIMAFPIVAFHPSQLSYGAMFGFGSKNGFYIKLKSDLRHNISTSDECDANGILRDGTMGWFTGKENQSRIALTAGAYSHIAGPFRLYVGAGYGRRVLSWESYEGQHIMVGPQSSIGLELDCGLITNFKFLSFLTGVSTTHFRWAEADFGIGFIF